MDHDFEQDTLKTKEKNKGIGGNTILLIIMSCWLLFYVYTGSHGRG